MWSRSRLGAAGAICGNPLAASAGLALGLAAIDGTDGFDLEPRPGRVVEAKFAGERVGLPSPAGAYIGDQRVEFGGGERRHPCRGPRPNQARIDLGEMIGHQTKVSAARVVVGQTLLALVHDEDALQFGNAKARDEGGIVAAPPITSRNVPVFGDLRWRLARKRPGEADLVGRLARVTC
jgi:hypothetical protein